MKEQKLKQPSKDWLLNWLVITYDRLGFEAKDGESDEDELVRQLAVSMMIRSNDAEAGQVASQIFAAHKGESCRTSSSYSLTSSDQ